MTCDDALAWIDADEAAPAEVAAHRAACASCDQAFRDAEKLDLAIRALPLREPDWNAWDAKLQAALARPRRRTWPYAASAAAALVVAALAWTFRPAAPPAPEPTPLVSTDPLPSPEGPTALTRFTLAFERYAGGAKEPEAELLDLARELWPHLVLKIESPEPPKVEAALALLERLRPAAAVPAMEARLDGEGWRNRLILCSLARFEGPAATRALWRALRDPELQADAVAACGGMTGETPIRTLLALYPQFGSEARRGAREILAARGDSAKRHLAAQLRASNEATAAALAPLAAALDLKEAVPTLVALSRSDDHGAAAMDALGTLGDASLLRALIDRPANLVARFVTAKGDDGIRELCRIAGDGDAKTARAAVALLPQFKGEAPRQALVRAASRPATRLAAVAALEGMDGVPAGDLVAIVLDPMVPAAAGATVLSDAPLDEIVPRLIAELGDYRRRPRAHDLLKRLTNRQLPPSAAAWESWWNTREPEGDQP